MKITFGFILYIFLACTASAQFVHNKVFGGSGDDIAMCVRATPDSGYIIAGYTNSTDGDVTGNHGSNDVWIVKIDSAWNIEWQKCLGGTESDVANSIALTADGGYVVGATTRSNDGDVSGNHNAPNTDYWVVKLDSSGNIQWQKCHGGTGNEKAMEILQTRTGEYIIAGEASGYWIVKLDTLGNMQWGKSLSPGIAYSIKQTNAGEYIIAGTAASTNRIILIDSLGGTIWQKDAPTTTTVKRDGRSVIQTSSGDYLTAGARVEWFCGYGCSTEANFDLVKFDSIGNILWIKTLYFTSNGNLAMSLTEVVNGGYLITGKTGAYGGCGSVNCLVYKLNDKGDVLWEQVFGGCGDDQGKSIVGGNGGSYVVAGHSSSNDYDLSGNHGGYDFWVFEVTEPPCINPVLSPPGTIDMCFGDTVVLTLTGMDTATYNVTETGDYSYTRVTPVSHGTCTVYSDTVRVIASPACTISGTAAICLGDSTYFTAAAGSSYTWSGPNGFTATSSAIGPIADLGAYQVTVTDTNGCIRACSKTLALVAPCTITGANSLCMGDSTTFTTTANALSYQWSGPSGFTSTTSSTGKIFTAGTYSLTMTDSTGCTRICARALAFHPTPSMQFHGDTTKCAGQSTNLSAIPPSGFCSYQSMHYDWTGPNGFFNHGPYTGSVSEPGNYTLILDDCYGCTTTRSVQVIDISGTACNITGDSVLCAGETTVLEASGALIYTWDGPNGFLTNSANTGIVSAPGIYSVTVTGANGCSNVCTRNVAVLPTPTCNGLITGDNLTCINEPTIFVATDSLSNYSWQGPGGFSASTSSTGPILTPGTYYLTATNNYGCSKVCSRQLSVKQLPACTINGGSILCAAETTSLVASGGISYLWSGPDGFTDSGDSIGGIHESGSYLLTVSAANGCINKCGFTVTKLLPIFILVDSSVVDNGQQSGSITLSVYGGLPPFEFQWSNGATTKDIHQQAAGSYSVSVTDANDCVEFLQNIEVEFVNGVIEPYKEHITISPNPVQKILFVSLNHINQFSRITLADINGRVVAQSNSPEVSVEVLASGFYLAKVELKNGTVVVRKIIVN